MTINRPEIDPLSSMRHYHNILSQLARMRDLPKTAYALLDSALSLPMPEPKDGDILVTSGYGSATGQAFVSITVPALGMQIETDVARDLALNLLSAAEAGDSDAMMIQFLGGDLNMPAQQIGALLLKLRQLRQTVGNYGGSDETH